MKKVLASVIVLAALAAGTLTYVAAERARAEYRHWVSALSESEDLRVLDSDYQRGWLASTASTSLELRGSVGEAFRSGLARAGQGGVRSRVGVRLDHRIEHGLLPAWAWFQAGREGSPVVARIETSAVLDQETQNELLPIFGRVPALQATTDLRQSGVAEMDLSMAPADFHPKPTEAAPVAAWSARYEGLRGHFVFAPGAASFVGRLDSPGLSMLADGVRTELSGWSTSLDYSRERTLWVGETRQSLAAFRVVELEPALEDDPTGLGQPLVVFALEGLETEQSTDVSGASYASESELRISTVTVDGEAWGAAQLELDLRNLDAEAVSALQSAGDVSRDDADDPDAAGWLVWLPQLLSRGPVLDLASASLETPDGPVTLQGHLRLPESSPAMVPLLLQVLDAQLTAEGPLALLEAFAAEDPERFEALEEQGLVVPIGDRFRFQLSLRGGTLRANGLPLDPTPWIEQATPLFAGEEDAPAPGPGFGGIEIVVPEAEAAADGPAADAMPPASPPID